MALDGDRLGNSILAAIDAVGDKTDRAALFRALGNAIVAEIKTNAQVTTTVAVASVSGVTAGPAASGPGTGSGTGNVQ